MLTHRRGTRSPGLLRAPAPGFVACYESKSQNSTRQGWAAPWRRAKSWNRIEPKWLRPVTHTLFVNLCVWEAAQSSTCTVSAASRVSFSDLFIALSIFCCVFKAPPGPRLRARMCARACVCLCGRAHAKPPGNASASHLVHGGSVSRLRLLSHRPGWIRESLEVFSLRPR